MIFGVSGRCREDDNFDECYADNQALKSKCDMDVFVQLVSLTTGNVVTQSGIEVRVSYACYPNSGFEAWGAIITVYFELYTFEHLISPWAEPVSHHFSHALLIGACSGWRDLQPWGSTREGGFPQGIAQVG